MLSHDPVPRLRGSSLRRPWNRQPEERRRGPAHAAALQGERLAPQLTISQLACMPTGKELLSSLMIRKGARHNLGSLAHLDSTVTVTLQFLSRLAQDVAGHARPPATVRCTPGASIFHAWDTASESPPKASLGSNPVALKALWTCDLCVAVTPSPV